MAEYKWINRTLFVILLLQFKAVTGQKPPSFTSRTGDDVTLPCEDVINDQNKCDQTSWLVSNGVAAVELVNLGQMSKNMISKAVSDRLSVTDKCSLVIKNVTKDDVGRYTCRQFNKEGKQQGKDASVQVSIVDMTEHENSEVIFFCSVLTNECDHTVNWLYLGKNKSEVDIQQHTCSSRAVFPTLQKLKYYELLKCNVTDNKSGKMLLCNVGPQSSCEKTGWMWLYLTIAVGLTALLAAILVVVVIRRRKGKGNKTQIGENVGLSLNPAVTQSSPETSQVTADPEDGVSYASISYTKKTNSKVQVQVKDDDDQGDEVTYSTVKASSSPAAGATADVSDLYTTVNKPNN